MPYPQDLANLSIRISASLRDEEIRNDIDEAGANEDDLKAALIDIQSDVWTSAASQIDDYNQREKARDLGDAEIAKMSARLKPWLWGLLWIGVLVATSLTFPALAYLGIGSLAVLLGIPVYWLWLRRSLSAAKVKQQAINTELPVRLANAHKAVEMAITPNIRSYLTNLHDETYGVELPRKAFSGLAEIEGSQFEISTEARDKVKSLIGTMQSASLGISGPRGAGKTTLLWSVCQAGKTNRRVLSLFTSAPVLYDAREFLLHIFASLAARVIEKESGVPANRRWLDFDDLQKSSPVSRVVDPRVFASAAFLASLFLLYAGLSFGELRVRVLKRQAQEPAHASAQSQSQPRVSNPNDPLMSLVDVFGINPGAMMQYGAGLFLIAWTLNASQPTPLGLPALAMFALNGRRRRSAMISGVQDEQKPEGIKEATEILRALRVQQTYSSGWSGSLKFPVGIESSANSTLTWAEKQLSLPELVDEYRKFLGRASTMYDQIIIAIDELDKLASDELAEQFLNGIKAIFGQTGVFYLVSVSQNAMSSFECRGLPFRDVFDSSFDDVLNLDYLNLDASRRVIGRRVVGLPHPFVCFCHSMSGGLPRDLIRQCRGLFEQMRLRPDSTHNLASISKDLALKEVHSKIAAITIASQKLALDNEVSEFLNLLKPKGEWNNTTMSEVLRGLQNPYELLKKRLIDQSPPPEDLRKLTSLYEEAQAYLSFLLTVYELFGMKMDEKTWSSCVQDGTFDRLASVRQMMSVNRMMAVAAAEKIRQDLKLTIVDFHLPDIPAPSAM